MTTVMTTKVDSHVWRRTTRSHVRMERTWKKLARRTWDGTSTARSQRSWATYGGESDGPGGRPKPWDLAILPAWLLEWIAKRVYPTSEATCAPGQYYDPNADACVFVCQEGYYYDPETRSCKKVRDVQTNLRPVEQYATRNQAEAKWDLRQTLARAMANALLGDRFRSKNAADNCAVGFYFDPVTKACVPLCGHGYVYDKIRKECVPEDGRTKHRS
mmetsp:Transcript_3105/g.19145  ORF Transcript_3105/g.19145 Transcript_3105/m.19145 type:complete len:216 (-) Transcript_3105:834-1481(-)